MGPGRHQAVPEGKLDGALTRDGADATAWRALPGTLAASWPCSDDGVVFDSASGDTHRLDALVFEVYSMVAEHPRRFDEIVAALFDPGEAWHGADGRHRVAQALRLLERLRLIQGAPQ